MALEELESARHVRLFHETVGDQGLIEATALDYAHLGALAIGEAGHLRVDDREENDPLMQDLVVLQVVQEHRRHRAAIGRQIDRGPLYTRHVGTEHRSKRFDRNADLSFPGHYDAFGALPGREHRENHHAAGEREPAAFGELHGIGCEEHQLDERDRCDCGEKEGPRAALRIERDGADQQGGEDHRARHRNAVSRRDCAGGLELEHEQHDQYEHGPVYVSDVDLAALGLGGVRHGYPRQVPEAGGLLGHGECARDCRLRGDDRSGSCKGDEGKEQFHRCEQIERVLDRRRIAQNERALADVVDHQRWEDHSKPGKPNRLRAEMPHVGVERFCTGDGEEHCAKDEESERREAPGKLQRLPGIERREHRRHLHDRNRAEHRKRAEPDHHAGPEELAHRAAATVLDRKQTDQDSDGDGHDPFVQRGRSDRDTFDRRKHGNRRCQQRVAVEERRSEYSRCRNRPCEARAVARRARSEREKGKDAALAAVVETQHHGHVLERHDQHQRPEHQRQHRQDVGLVQRQAVRAAEGFLERVQRTCADVSVDHAQREKGKCGQFRLAGFRDEGTAVAGSGRGVHGRPLLLAEGAQHTPVIAALQQHWKY